MARKYKFRLTESDYQRFEEMSRIEKDLMASGHQYIAGVDEAGRGPLAGPVSVAACILDPNQPIYGLNDSKKLTEKRREYLFKKIKEKALTYKMILVDVNQIEDFNILGATKRGMAEAILGLSIQPDIALLDAVRLDNPEYAEKMPAQRSLVHGDALSNSIAAASVLAKVNRDRYMVEQAKIYPDYQFDKHKGYATKAHYEAIQKYGISPIHRLSFLHKLKLGSQQTESTKDLGYQAEEEVTKHLIHKGYQVLEKNFWLSNFGEIDLILRKDNRLLFVEVKARHNQDYEDLGIRALNQKKVWKIKCLADYYFKSRNITADEIIFLLAAVKLDAHNQVEKIKYHDF